MSDDERRPMTVAQFNAHLELARTLYHVLLGCVPSEIRTPQTMMTLAALIVKTQSTLQGKPDAEGLDYVAQICERLEINPDTAAS